MKVQAVVELTTAVQMHHAVRGIVGKSFKQGVMAEIKSVEVGHRAVTINLELDVDMTVLFRNGIQGEDVRRSYVEVNLMEITKGEAS